MNWPVVQDVRSVEPDFVRAIPESGQVKVLVVDDEPLIRWAVTEMLCDLGCHVVQAGDARSAVGAVAEPAAFEIVLLDLRLPDSDGLILLTRLRSLIPDARIIVMTAHGTREMAERARDLGAFAFVGKPFELTELAALVRQAHEARHS